MNMRMTVGVFTLILLANVAAAATPRHGGSYVLATDEMRVSISAGTTVESVKSLRDRYSGRFLWVRTNGQTWLIDDADLLDRATSFFAEELALEPEQRAIAGEEAELDREEERLEDRHDAASEARLDEIRRKQRD